MAAKSRKEMDMGSALSMTFDFTTTRKVPPSSPSDDTGP